VSASAPLVEARRFLHCCYCCDDALATTRFFEAGLDLELKMRSHGERVDGTQMGFPGDVETDACFVYDRRGPRVSPAIEVQRWTDPPLVGTPYDLAHDIGFHAIGVAVPRLDAATERLVALGSIVAEAAPASGVVDGSMATVRDPTGVSLDLVETPSLGDDTQLAHIRATCSDLDRSVAWYETIGFGLATEERLPATSSARLRLPDEPFSLILTEWHEPRSQGTPYGSGNHRGLYRFAIAVDDTRAAYDLLAEHWPLASPPRRVELGGTNVPDMWIAFLTDPDGLVIELVERPRSAFR